MSRGIYIRTDCYTIHIPIYDKVTVITGNSGSGKTLLVNTIDLLCKVFSMDQNKILESTINMNDIIVVRDKVGLELLLKENPSGKFIFIDRMNMLYCDELDKFMDESKNLFVVFGHGDISELTGQDAVLGLKSNGKDFECYRIYARGLLHPTESI